MISYPIEFFCGFWLFMVGATIGSFLNVVAYRLPGGLTLLGFSRCPKCHAKIRIFDNIPVFAWFILRGRCRNCGLPIATRYPIVEAICGIVFLSIGIADFAYRAANVPGVSIPLFPCFAESLIAPSLENVTLFLIHASLMTLLLTCALIEYDGHRAVPRLFLLLIVGGFVTMVISPSFPIGVSTIPPKFGASLGHIFSGLAAGDVVTRIYGVIVGALLGFVVAASSVDVNAAAEEKIRSATLLWALVGLWLGLFQILSIFLVAIIFRLIAPLLDATVRRSKRSRIFRAPIGLLYLATWFHIVLWSLLGRLPGWPINGYSDTRALIWIFGGCIALLLVSLFSPGRRRGSPFAESEL